MKNGGEWPICEKMEEACGSESWSDVRTSDGVAAGPTPLIGGENPGVATAGGGQGGDLNGPDDGHVMPGGGQDVEAVRLGKRDGGGDGGGGCDSDADGGGVCGGVSRVGDSGWLIDESGQLVDLYGAGGGGTPPLRPDRRLWQIATPYLMDQQAANIARQMETGEIPAGRRRRRPPPPRPDPVTAAAVRLLAAAAARAEGPSPTEYRQNNSTARRAARELLERSGPPLSGPSRGGNPSDAPRVITAGRDRYVLPARSRFVCGDVTTAFDDVTVVTQALGGGPRFDCVLLDPPWSNKFVRRKRKRHERTGYQSLEAADLTRLPLHQLAADGALVAVWCTNSSAHRRTLSHTLLPAWGVRECAVWHWVKVTQHGQPVTPAGSQHSKQPYEVLVLGRRGPQPPGLPAPPADQLLVSVPCAVHSRKPLLHDLLRPYLPGGYRGLEVFARGLQPGWTSWGDQPLLLQRLGGLLVTGEQDGELQRQQEEELRQEGEQYPRQGERQMRGGKDQPGQQHHPQAEKQQLRQDEAQLATD